MSLEINEDQNEVRFNAKAIIDCAHLIDLPPVKNTFDQKEKGKNIRSPKVGIKILTAFYHKNGLSNLL